MRYIRFALLGLMVLALTLTATTVLAQERINVGDTVTGTRTDSDNDYLVDLEAGTLVVITVESEDFDSNVRVLNASGTELAYDDDSGGNRNPYLAFFAPETATYTIRVGAFFDMGSGAFTLRVVAGVVTPVGIGDTLAVDFDGTPKFFALQANAGDVVTIGVASDSGISTNLSLTAPDGTVVGDTSASFFFFGSTQLRRVALPLSGLYFLSLTSYSTDVSETLSLSVVADTALSLDGGEVSLTLSEATTDFDVVRFTGKAGVTYVLTVTTDNPEKGVRLTIPVSVDSFGYAEEAEFSIRRATGGTIEFTVPEDRLIAIVVSESSFFSFTDAPSNITLSIQAK